MKYIVIVLFCFLSGCSGPTFTNLGNGVAVPVESIDRYAAENGLTPAQAQTQLRRESDQRRVKEHAAKFGISEAEANRQLDHSNNQ